MSVTTARNLINKALLKLGVLAEGETGSAPQLNDGLDALNIMLDSMAAEGLCTIAQIRENFALTANTGSYLIGSNQTFDTTKPHEILSAFVRDSSNNDTPVHVTSQNIYDSYTAKNTAGKPTSLFYYPGATQQANQTGTIYLYPVPDSAYTLYINSEKPFTQFANLTSNVTFPTAYNKLLIYSLALELAPDYHITPLPSIVTGAQDAKDIITRVNAVNKRTMPISDLPGSRRNWNIYNG